jgi:hypothetical protein
MPQVRDKILKDGWYVNQAKNSEGKPRPLSLGAVMTMKPGAKKHFKASDIQQSRATHTAFVAALANGNLVAEGGEVKQAPPAPEPVVEEPPVVVDPPTPEEPVDETLTRSDLQSMNKTSLIELAEGMGLDIEGTKAEIVDRILVNQE